MKRERVRRCICCSIERVSADLVYKVEQNEYI